MTDHSNGTKDSLFTLAGGETGVRKIIELFYDRVFDDPMIGFFFRDADRNRLIEKECELSAKFLGADHIEYTGQPLPTAHARHPIMGGHFDRRTQILRECLESMNVPVAVKDAWLQHTEALRPQITRDRGSECDHDRIGWKPPSDE